MKYPIILILQYTVIYIYNNLPCIPISIIQIYKKNRVQFNALYFYSVLLVKNLQTHGTIKKTLDILERKLSHGVQL